MKKEVNNIGYRLLFELTGNPFLWLASKSKIKIELPPVEGDLEEETTFSI